MPREIARLNYQPRTQDSYYVSRPDPLKRALAEPNNLGAHLNSIWRTRDFQRNYFEYSPNLATDDDPPVQPEIEEWLTLIEKRFKEPWLPAFLSSVRLNRQGKGFDYFPLNGPILEQRTWLRQNPPRRALKLKKMLEAGARREPRNVFWVLQLARWEWNYSPRTFYPPPRSNLAIIPPPSFLSSAGSAMPPIGPPGPPGPMSPPIELFGPHPLPPLVPNEDAVVKRTFAILSRARACTYFEDGNWFASRIDGAR